MARAMNRLESELLRTFLAVVDTGSLTRAGERVGRTQSAVSMQVKRLEEDVGAPLFVRGARGVVLTVKGEQLLGNARRIVALIDETSASLATPPLIGKVRLGIPEEYGEAMLAQALSAFARVHPEVEIRAHYGRSDDHMAALSQGELDLTAVFEWQEFSDGELLMKDPTVWVTCDVHDTHRRNPLPIAIYESAGWCAEFALGFLEKRKFDYRIAYRSGTTGGLKLAVTSGLAIAPISRSNIPAGCRELTVEEGFGEIDASKLVLHRNPLSQEACVEAMAGAFRDAFAVFPTRG